MVALFGGDRRPGPFREYAPEIRSKTAVVTSKLLIECPPVLAVCFPSRFCAIRRSGLVPMQIGLKIRQHPLFRAITEAQIVVSNLDRKDDRLRAFLERAILGQRTRAVQQRSPIKDGLDPSEENR